MPTDGNPLQFIVPYLIIGLIFYFLVFRPQSQQRQQHKTMVDNLKKNDQVVTTGGIHGTVVNVKDKTIIIRIDDNARMEIDKEAVATVVKSSTPSPTKDVS